MKKSKQLLKVSSLLLLLVFVTGNLQAQEEKQKEEKRKKNRRSWIKVTPPAPIPPVPAVTLVPPVEPVPPVPPISPIDPIIPAVPVAPIVPTMAPIAPISPVTPIIPMVPVTAKANGRIIFYSGNKGLTIREQNGFYTEVQGKVRFDRDNKLFKSISRNGYVKIKDKHTGKEILVEEEDGVLYYNYYNRGRKLPFEKEGKAWLEEIWRDVVRQMGR